MLNRALFLGLIGLVIWLSPTITIAQTGLAERAEQNYKRTHYQNAAQNYRRLLKQSRGDYRVLYNLGNVFYKQGEIGKAIWYFRRALKSAPRDEDTRHNLRLAKAKVIDEVKTQDQFTSPLIELIGTLSFNEGLGLLLVLGTCCNVFWLLWFLRERKVLYQNLFYCFLGMFLLSLCFFGVKANTEYFTHNGILISKKIEVKSGPSKTLSTVFLIHAGTEFLIMKQGRFWAEIRLKNGFRGWVPNASFWEI